MYRRMMGVGVSSGWVTHSNADSNNSKDGLTNTSQYSVVEWSWWRYDINGKIKTGFSVISHMQLVGFCDQHGLCVCVCVCDKTVSPDSVISCTKPKKLPLLLPLFLLDWKIGRGPLLSLTDEFFISYICLNQERKGHKAHSITLLSHSCKNTKTDKYKLQFNFYFATQ